VLVTRRSSERGAGAGADGAPRQRRPDGKAAVVVLRVPLSRRRGRGRHRRGLHSPRSPNPQLSCRCTLACNNWAPTTSLRELDGRAGTSPPLRVRIMRRGRGVDGRGAGSAAAAVVAWFGWRCSGGGGRRVAACCHAPVAERR
jgi:hypothetical protein